MADGFIAAFQTATGLTVDYKEDYNDNEEWFAMNKEPLSRKQDIGADLVVPTQFMAARLNGLGWLNGISEDPVDQQEEHARRPAGRQGRLRPEVQSAPHMSGMTALASITGPRPAATSPRSRTCNRPSRARSACWPTPRTGSVRSCCRQGSVENPTIEYVQKAVDLIKERRTRARSGASPANDHADDPWHPAMWLSPRRIRVTWCSCRRTTRPEVRGSRDRRHDVRRHHGHPHTTQNQKAAEEWINYVYDRPNYAKLIAHTQYVPVLSDMSDELNKIDPKLASNPLINPPKETLDKLKTLGRAHRRADPEFNKAYATVTGG